MNSTSFSEIDSVTPRKKGRYRRVSYILIAGVGLIATVVFVQTLNSRRLTQAQRQASLQSMALSTPQRMAVQWPNNLNYAQNALPNSTQAYLPNYSTSIAPQSPAPYFNPTPSYVNPTPSFTNNYQNTTSISGAAQDLAEAAAMAQVKQLQNQWRSANSEQKKTLRTSLNEALTKLFDLRHANQGKQVAQLETELAEAKELHKKRGERKDEIVERRLSELLDSPDDLAWNRELNSRQPPSVATSPSYTPNPPYNNYNSLPYSNGSVINANPAYAVPQSTPSGTFGLLPNASSLNPLSATPPQLIPMESNGLGSNGLLPNSLNSTSSNPSMEPAAAASSASSFLSEDPNSTNGNPTQSSLPTVAESSSSSATNATGSLATSRDRSSEASISRTAIEAGYELETALGRAIRAYPLVMQGLAPSEQAFEADRAVAKAQAIWSNLVSQSERSERRTIEGLMMHEQSLDGANVSRSERLEWQKERSRLQEDIETLKDAITWMERFENESLAPLQAEFDELKPKPAKQKGAQATEPSVKEKAESSESTESADSTSKAELDALMPPQLDDDSSKDQL